MTNSRNVSNELISHRHATKIAQQRFQEIDPFKNYGVDPHTLKRTSPEMIIRWCNDLYSLIHGYLLGRLKK